MIKLVFRLFALILTLLVLYSIWDVSRFIYGRFKFLFMDIYCKRREYKLKKKEKPKVESASSKILEQYGGVLERIEENE